jgi:hypothetical protein
MATIPEALKVLLPLTSQIKVREALKVRLQMKVCASTQLTDYGLEARKVLLLLNSQIKVWERIRCAVEVKPQ